MHMSVSKETRGPFKPVNKNQLISKVNNQSDVFHHIGFNLMVEAENILYATNGIRSGQTRKLNKMMKLGEAEGLVCVCNSRWMLAVEDTYQV